MGIQGRTTGTGLRGEGRPAQTSSTITTVEIPPHQRNATPPAHHRRVATRISEQNVTGVAAGKGRIRGPGARSFLPDLQGGLRRLARPAPTTLPHDDVQHLTLTYPLQHHAAALVPQPRSTELPATEAARDLHRLIEGRGETTPLGGSHRADITGDTTPHPLRIGKPGRGLTGTALEEQETEVAAAAV